MEPVISHEPNRRERNRDLRIFKVGEEGGWRTFTEIPRDEWDTVDWLALFWPHAPKGDSA